MEKDIKRSLDRVNEKLSTLLVREKQPKITLVKIGIVQKLTGLDREGMRQARNNNLIVQVKNEKGIWYELETIHPILIDKTHAPIKQTYTNRRRVA